MRRWAGVLVLGASLCVAGSGCAANSSGTISKAAANALGPAVQAVRQAASTGSYFQLKAAVANLEDLVKQEKQAGHLSGTRANEILNAADALLVDASPSPSPTPTFTEPPTTTTLPTTTPTPTPSATGSASASSTSSPTDSETPLVNVSAGG